MRKSKRFIAVPVTIFAVLNLATVMILAVIAERRIGGMGWPDVLLPPVISLCVVLLAVSASLLRLDAHPRWRGTLWGALTGGALFLVFQTWSLIAGFEVITREGVSYWGFSLMCP